MRLLPHCAQVVRARVGAPGRRRPTTFVRHPSTKPYRRRGAPALPGPGGSRWKGVRGATSPAPAAPASAWKLTLAPGHRPRARGDLDHLEAFFASRGGVEAYVEPATLSTSTTLVLVAGDGEWTRRRVGSPREAFAFGRRLGLPVYDVAATGYPARMREWTARRKAEGRLGPER